MVEVKIEDLHNLDLNVDSRRLRQPGEPVSSYWVFVFVDLFWICLFVFLDFFHGINVSCRRSRKSNKSIGTKSFIDYEISAG